MAPRRGLFQQSAGAPALAWLPWLLMLQVVGTWAMYLLFLPGLGVLRSSAPADGGLRLLPTQPLQARGRTLVIYVFSGSDPEYADNLRFFVREAVKVCKAQRPRLPPLPASQPACQAELKCAGQLTPAAP